MVQRLMALIAWLAFVTAAAAAPETAPRPPDRAAGAMKAALNHAREGDWQVASDMARNAGPIGEDVLTWYRLRAGEGTWREYRRFLARNPDWPGLARLHRAGEEAFAEAAPHEAVAAYFETRAPATGRGALALIGALEALGRTGAAAEQAERAWRRLTLTPPQQEELLGRYATRLSPLHEARLDELLWRGDHAAAERMLPLVEVGLQRLAEARVALAAREPGVDARIDAVPDRLADDPGLAHARFDWRMRKGRHADAAELLRARSTDAATLGRPEAWARDRTYLAREALARGDTAEAYEIAANHFLSEGARFAALEWLAGYIALSRLDEPRAALRHFQTLRSQVSTPISLGRAGYWEGRAHDALGEDEAARAAYAYAAEHQTSFYGLLAAETAGIALEPALADGGPRTNWRDAPFMQSPVMEAAQLLHRAGAWHDARRFLLHLGEGLDGAGLERLSDFALDLGEPNYALNIAKDAAARGHILPRAYFPLGDVAEMELPVSQALVLAVARRESEFNPAAVSHAGALGLMQLLPGTARMMAQRLGIDYAPGRLTRDPAYNARLGAEYLAELREEFGESSILVAAGYNAGPGRPRRWIEELGDPRNPAVDPVDWIENVPFAETRNYIMRVMEAVIIYRARLEGDPEAPRLRAALAKG